MPLTQTFDTWPVAQLPHLPSHSRLYRLEPIGIGTGSVEGLTSYVMRLATAHAVSVGDLLGRELFPGTAPSIRESLNAKRITSQGFGSASYWVNGTSACPATWIAALESATLQNNLRFLTLLPFARALSELHLPRMRRAWCPACLEEKVNAGDAIYEFLAWGFRIIKVCARHRTPLEEVCQHCARPMKPLGIYSRPGCCALCGGWLGLIRLDSSQSSVSDYDLWLANSMGELLASAPTLNTESLGTILRENISALIGAIAAGSQVTFERATNCSRRILAYWLNGTTLPRLDLLLPICHRLKVLPVNLFRETLLGRGASLGLAVSTNRSVRLLCRREEVRAVLKAALTEDPPPTVSTLSIRMGRRSSYWLYQIDSNLCKEITANSLKSNIAKKPLRCCHDLKKVEVALKIALTQQPAISLYMFAASLGYASGTSVSSRFPALSTALSKRFAEQRRTRHEILLQKALDEYPPPTLSAVAHRLHRGVAMLQQAFPDICNRLSGRRAAFLETKVARWHLSLEAALKETPPPARRPLCQHLGLGRVVFKRLFPELWNAIGARYEEARERRKDP
jgi:hypothetical protein